MYVHNIVCISTISIEEKLYFANGGPASLTSVDQFTNVYWRASATRHGSSQLATVPFTLCWTQNRMGQRIMGWLACRRGLAARVEGVRQKWKLQFTFVHKRPCDWTIHIQRVLLFLVLRTSIDNIVISHKQ